jgi:putative flippase GtrA
MEARTASRGDPGILVRWIRHLLAGGFGTLLYIGMVAFLVEVTGLHPVTSVIVAFIVMELYTYTIFRAWVYSPKNGHTHTVPRFLVVTAVALALNTGLMYLVVETLGYWYGWGLLVTALFVPATNFLLNYYWAFK